MDKVEAPSAPASPTRGRSSLLTQAALVLTLVLALLAVLLISERSEEPAEPQALLPASDSAPRIGVATSASKSSLSDALKDEINNAPDMAQAALTDSVSSTSSTSAHSLVIPEETSDVSLRIAERTSPKAASSGPAVVSPQVNSQLQASSALSSRAAVATGQTADVAGFSLQLGVFSNIGNAEALQRKLKRAGITSQLETRVQLGPFRTKEEAVHAQEKLRRLGLASGLMIPLQKRHE